MKGWKRWLFVAYLACMFVVTVLFAGYTLESDLHPMLKFLCFLVAVVVLAGFGAGVAALVVSFAHERTTLHVGPNGVINIEKSALESTARSALSSFEAVTIVAVHASVLESKGATVMDFTIVAVPHGVDSLMSMAARIQSSVKRSIEAFTDHEVRYVGVNFIEPRSKDDARAAHEAAERYAQGEYRPARYGADATAQQVADAASDEVTLADREPGSGGVLRSEVLSGLTDKVKGMWARRVSTEDVVDTPATVEPVCDPDQDLAFQESPEAPRADEEAPAESEVGREGEFDLHGDADRAEGDPGDTSSEGADDNVSDVYQASENKNGGA